MAAVYGSTSLSMAAPEQADMSKAEHPPVQIYSGGCGLCCSCIPTGSVGVVQTFGEFKGIQEPGCTPYCVPFTTIQRVSLAITQLQCHSDCKTKDNVTLRVSTAVQYRIHKPMVKTAVFDIVDPVAQINSEVDNVLRSTLPMMDLDEAFSAKDHMVSNILSSVKKSMSPHGYNIINVLITDLRPEQSVLQAMNEINAARRQRDAAADRGEADKILKIKAAEADAEAKYQSGVGIARMRKAVADGFKDSMNSISEAGISTESSMHMMIVTQYLDTLKEFANGRSSIMVPHGPGAVRDIESQVRNGFLQSEALSAPLVPSK